MNPTPLTTHVHKFAGTDMAHRFEERAAIHEDSHVDRATAERLAYEEVVGGVLKP